MNCFFAGTNQVYLAILLRPHLTAFCELTRKKGENGYEMGAVKSCAQKRHFSRPEVFSILGGENE